MNSNVRSTLIRDVYLRKRSLNQVGYCPLVWMFHIRNLNNRITVNEHLSALGAYLKNKRLGGSLFGQGG